MKNQRTSIIDHLAKKITKKYLKKQSKIYIENYDQLVTLSFDFMSRNIEVNGVYELKELNSLKDSYADFLLDKCVIDVGANIGNHTVFFSKIAKMVYSFEPNETIFELLQINTKKYRNIEVFNFGCSDKEQTLAADIDQKNWGSGRISDSNSQTCNNTIHSSFTLKTLDSVEVIKNETIGLIKIDVEGHELPAMKGMTETLKRDKPIIVFEQNSGIMNGTSREVEFLRTLGYKNLYEMGIEQQWLVPDFLPKPIKQMLRPLESILYGYPFKKLCLKPTNHLTKDSYRMLVMSSD